MDFKIRFRAIKIQQLFLLTLDCVPFQILLQPNRSYPLVKPQSKYEPTHIQNVSITSHQNDRRGNGANQKSTKGEKHDKHICIYIFLYIYV